MHITHQQEAFSRAFVGAMTAAAGFKSIPGGEPDDDSIDLILGATGAIGRMRSPKIEVQLKCRRAEVPREDFGFDLSLKNYVDLSGPLTEYQAPRILVVVFAPQEVERWAEQDDEALVLRHCAFWTCLHDLPPTTNQTSIRVRIEVDQVFTPSSLGAMMERVGNGGRP